MGDSLGDWYGCSLVLSACINYADYKVVEEELVPLFEELYDEYQKDGDSNAEEEKRLV